MAPTESTSRTSFVSVLAGTLVAFGVAALVLVAAGAVGSELGLDTDGVSSSEWRQVGVAGAVAAVLVVFGAFFFGGYTAGRMSRLTGTRHGALVFVLAAVVVGTIVGAAAIWGDADSVRDSLSDEGVPTDADTWSVIGIGAAVAAGLAMLLGSLFGGWRGGHWHDRLVVEADHPEPRRKLGDDPTTTVDLHAGDDEELSVEEERERARAGTDSGH